MYAVVSRTSYNTIVQMTTMLQSAAGETPIEVIPIQVSDVTKEKLQHLTLRNQWPLVYVKVCLSGDRLNVFFLCLTTLSQV